MPPSEAPSIDESTIEILESQVKKGKPRKFFLIYRGATIKRLEIFRRGPFGPRVMAARKAGSKGDVACGVVLGSGKNLCFYLAGTSEVAQAMQVDSFGDSPPTKVSKLHEFLSENGLKYKPTYELVSNPNDVVLPDQEEGDSQFPRVQAAAEEENGEARDASREADGAADVAAFKSRLTEILPRIKGAVGTAAGEQAKLLASEAGSLARSGDFEQAHARLDQAATFLADGSADKASAASTAEETRRKLAETLKKVIPAVKDVLDAEDTHPTAKVQLTELVTLLKQAVGANDIDQARQAVAQIVPAVKQVQHAEAANGQETSSVVDRIAPRVKMSQARLAWTATRKEVESDIERFKAAVLESGADEDSEYLRTVERGLGNLDHILGKRAEELEDYLDDGLNAEHGSPQQLMAYFKAQQAIDEYIEFATTDPLLQYIDDNSFAQVAIASRLQSSLRGLSQNLDS